MNMPTKPTSGIPAQAARPPRTSEPSPTGDADRLPRTKPVSSKHLDGISDLVVAAPLKQGFIDAFEHVTYETRLRMAMDALFKMRSTSREYNLIKPLVDSAERIQTIRSFRLAIVEVETTASVEKRLVLAVTFDKPWEPYIRQIWRPLGFMLDVIFCNCEGYVTAGDNSFEKYARWVRDNQVDTGFYYATSTLSVVDFQYLSQVERLQREKPGAIADGRVVELVAEDPEIAAERVREAQLPKTNDIALEALGALYRLTNYYPVDRPVREGRILHRAAHSLLHGWDSGRVQGELRTAFRDWLNWYENEAFSELEKPWVDEERDSFDAANVQGGIVTGYDTRGQRPITHGALLLLQARNGQAGRDFLTQIKGQITLEQAGAEPEDGIFLNLALTWRGLKNLGVPPAEMRKFPQEFIEGAEERAGLIGDVLSHHPRRWRVPARNWPPQPRNVAPPPVELAEIDIVLQLRVAAGSGLHALLKANGEIDEDHPLAERVKAMAAALPPGVELLAVESMRSKPVDGPGFLTREHFGFVDGLSQPRLAIGGSASGAGASPSRDRVGLGELLVGHGNDRGDRPAGKSDYLDDGSFLVVRKIRQDVAALNAWVETQCAIEPGLSRDRLLAAMVGRKPTGEPLVPGETTPPDGGHSNDFDYENDPKGQLCPLQAHVRRANPRRKDSSDRPTPRILRRGMSYGPRYDDAPQAERGLMFMSYQSSIAEQYEVIQRWLNGGNSTFIGSGMNDPISGLGRPGDPRTFVWRDGNNIYRHPLDSTGGGGAGKPGINPFTQLDWMLYLFTPSMAAIEKIAHPAGRPDSEPDVGYDLLVELGRKLIKKAQLAERLLGLQEDLAPLDRALHGPPDGQRQRATDRLWKPIRVVLALVEIVGRKLRKWLFPRLGDFDHLARAGLAWKAFLEDFGAKDPAERSYGPAVWAAIRKDHGGALRVPYCNLGADEDAQGEAVEAMLREDVEQFAKGAEHRPTQMVVLVARKTLVTDVYLNRRRLYSVAGQGKRMETSFGTIFIGMDDGRQYRAESEDTNRILNGKCERRAFEAAYEKANAILDQAFEDADKIRKDVLSPDELESRTRTAKIDLTSQFITPALADICTHWFGIPDPAQQHVERGSWRREGIRDGDRPRCPGDFMAPSRYMFYPDPNRAVQHYGRRLGVRLHDAVFGMFKERYDRAVAAGRDEPVHAAEITDEMFEVVLLDKLGPDPSDAEVTARVDLLTRNVIGAMTGMLPPTDGNLRGALHGWLKDKSLWRVQHGLATAPGETPYERAWNGLLEPLKAAMQKRPSPDIVWRTANATHKIGEDGERTKVRKGEKLFVGIVSATMQDLEKETAGVEPIYGGNPGHQEAKGDVYPVFGGDRAAQPHPIHACPGYRMAMGTMMGILFALFEKGRIEALAAPLMVRVTDLTPRA